MYVQSGEGLINLAQFMVIELRAVKSESEDSWTIFGALPIVVSVNPVQFVMIPVWHGASQDAAQRVYDTIRAALRDGMTVCNIDVLS
jgi:hypothetical protein